MNLQVEYVSIDEIFPYANNAKIHTDEQIDEIANSINEFGMIDPIGIWKNNEIIEGHGRLMACKKLGIKMVPIIRLDELTDEQRKAYALAHNKLTMNTDFDNDLLDFELGNISMDMEKFGFLRTEEIEEAISTQFEKPEVQFTEVLGEEHNYIVLYFDNDIDWLQITSLLDISEKKNLSTRKDGVINKSMERKSIGRVFKGKEVLERLREQFENIN